jgi:hypothetical protein
MVMRARAQNLNAKTFAYGAFDSDEDYAPGEFFAGERICPPRSGSGGNAMLRAYLVIFIAAGGGWALLGNHANWQEWLSAKIAAVSHSISAPASVPVEPVASAAAAPVAPPANTEPTTAPAALEPPPATLQPVESKEIAPAPGEASPLATAAIAPATGEPDVAALPPPTPDPSDPYQMRASAVGLHPDLSRVLLTRLSPTDYRNAGIAIETAVAKTPDNGVFVWPRQRKPELALFEVHFVPGAAAGCRRYVVTVTKDGWSTTALPMEKCGVRVAGRGTK